MASGKLGYEAEIQKNDNLENIFMQVVGANRKGE